MVEKTELGGGEKSTACDNLFDVDPTESKFSTTLVIEVLRYLFRKVRSSTTGGVHVELF